MVGPFQHTGLTWQHTQVSCSVLIKAKIGWDIWEVMKYLRGGCWYDAMKCNNGQTVLNHWMLRMTLHVSFQGRIRTTSCQSTCVLINSPYPSNVRKQCEQARPQHRGLRPFSFLKSDLNSLMFPAIIYVRRWRRWYDHDIFEVQMEHLTERPAF